MNIVRVTKEFHFEMAHALLGYDGLCKNIHGHSYKLHVTLKGSPIKKPDNPKIGMVIDFGDLKDIINKSLVEFYDHSLLLNAAISEEKKKEFSNFSEKVFFVDFQPTCENLVIHMVGQIKELLPENLELHSLRLYETATSYAEWFAEDNQ